MKRTIRVSLFLLPLLSCSMVTAATPVITSLTSMNGSTITNLAILTLNGSNFGALTQPKPLDHANFSKDINPSSFSFLTTWNENSYMAWTTAVSTGLAGVIGAAYGIWQSSDTGARAFHFRVRNADPYQQIYLYWRKWTSQGSTPNNKFYRIWRNGNGGPNDFVTSTDQGGVCFNEEEPSINGVIGGYQYAYFSTGTWSNQRAIWKRIGGTGLNSDGSAGPGGTGVWDMMVNSRTWQHRENVNNFSDLLTELVVGDFTDAAHLQPDGTMIQMASVYVSTVSNAVFLSTNSTFAIALVDMQPQPLILMTSTAAVFAVDRTGIDTSKQVYAYVMGATTADVNTSGFPANIGASATQLAPFIVPIVGISSFSVNWSSAGASYVAVVSKNSDFSSPISSGALTGQTTSYATNLAQRTTYYFEVKVATDPDSGYSGSISTATSGTILAAVVGSPAQTSLTGNWVGAMTIVRVWDDNPDFSSPISSGSASSPDTQGSLTCNTQYYFEVKVASETAYDGNIFSGMTSACSASTSGPAKIGISGISGSGLIFR